MVIRVKEKSPYKNLLIIACFGLFFSLFFTSCGNRDGANLKRYDLFTIPLGILPNELDWFYRDGFRMAGVADIQTHDGLIFLSGGDAGKVMIFNSYGDLITYVYDPERNPKPVTLEEGLGEKAITSWNFRSPRSIATNEEGFLVDDGVEIERRVKDSESELYYDRVVLRFSREGKYLGHIGQEGYGGSPFPYIASLHVREDGGTVVISRTPSAWISYWFDKNGYPVTTVKIQEDQLPGLEDGGRVAIYSMHPDPVDWLLHLRSDVYFDTRIGDLPEPRLYTLDIVSLTYAPPIILGYLESNSEHDIPTIPPEYLGTTKEGNHLMLASEGWDLYRMTLIDREGRTIQNRRIKVQESTTVYRRFKLQNNGMLTSLLCDDKNAYVAWWRVDKLIENER